MKKELKMKTFIVPIFLILSSVLSVRAQSNFGTVQDGLMAMKLGPLFTAGAAVNAGDVLNGTKTSPGFACAPGALFDFTYTRNVGFDLGIAYDARTVNFHNQANSSVGVDYSFGYISLRPELRFGGFLIGVGLGLPIAVSTTASNGAIAPKVGVGDVNSLFEGRIGGLVELFRSDLGTLDFMVEGSYSFSRNLNSTWFHGTDQTKNNGPLATAEAGFTYLFDLLPTPVPPIAASR